MLIRLGLMNQLTPQYACSKCIIKINNSYNYTMLTNSQIDKLSVDGSIFTNYSDLGIANLMNIKQLKLTVRSYRYISWGTNLRRLIILIQSITASSIA